MVTTNTGLPREKKSIQGIFMQVEYEYRDAHCTSTYAATYIFALVPCPYGILCYLKAMSLPWVNNSGVRKSTIWVDNIYIRIYK